MYIEEAAISGADVTYRWKVHQGTELIESFSKNIASTVMELSLRANFALAIGVAEWIVWRLDSPSRYPQLTLYVNSLWARTVDKAYLKVNCLDTPPRDGNPAIEPMIATEDALYTAFRKSTQNHPERGAAVAGLVSLVRYTLPDAGKLDDWLRQTLGRFAEHFRFDPVNRPGTIVPRAFLDPATPVDPAAIPTLLDEQLRQIEWQGNPFLASPGEMRAAGFAGTPYRYLP
jgi:hypothetical protein